MPSSMCVPVSKSFPLCGHRFEAQVIPCFNPTDSCLLEPTTYDTPDELCNSCTLLPDPNPNGPYTMPREPHVILQSPWTRAEEFLPIESIDLNAPVEIDPVTCCIFMDQWLYIRSIYLSMRKIFWESLRTDHVLSRDKIMSMLWIRLYQDHILIYSLVHKMLRTEDRRRECMRALRKVDISSLSMNNRECGICRVPYGEADDNVPDEYPVELSCKGPIKHVFGNRCIEEWFREGHLTCPIDRSKIYSPDPDDSDNMSDSDL